MSENKINYEKFVVDVPKEELHGKRYGFVNGNRDKKLKGRRAAALKSPMGIYLLALVAFMLFWFIYSFVHAAITEKNAVGLLRFIPSFFVLAVCSLIILLSVFNAWAKFIDWALKRKLTAYTDEARAILEADAAAEAEEESKINEKESALNIYKDYIEVINYGWRRVLDKNLLMQVTIKKYDKVCYVVFTSFRGDDVTAYADVPATDAKKIKKIFGEKCTVVDMVGGAGKPEREYHYREKFEFDSGRLGGLVMGFICAAVGGGVIALHYYVDEKIPSFLGMFFIAGGCLVMLAVFDKVPIIKEVCIPFLFGVIFTGFPLMMALSIAQSEGIKVVLPTFHEFLCGFSPIYCGFFFFAGIGLMLIVYSFVRLFKLIIHR